MICVFFVRPGDIRQPTTTQNLFCRPITWFRSGTAPHSRGGLCASTLYRGKQTERLRTFFHVVAAFALLILSTPCGPAALQGGPPSPGGPTGLHLLQGRIAGNLAAEAAAAGGLSDPNMRRQQPGFRTGCTAPSAAGDRVGNVRGLVRRTQGLPRGHRDAPFRHRPQGSFS